MSRYSAWFMFDDHTTKKVEAEDLDVFIRVCEACFLEDSEGLLGHVKQNGQDIFGRDPKNLFFDIVFKASTISQLKESIIKAHNYSI